MRQEPHVASPSLSKERSNHRDIGDCRNLPFSPDECIASPRMLLSQLDKVDNQDISKDDRLSLTNILSKTQSRQFLIQQLLDNPVYYQEIQERLQSWQAPILSKASYNNRPVNWSTCSTPYPINERAFSVYSHGTKRGQPRNNIITEGKAKQYAKNKVIKALLNVGSTEQILLNVLSDRRVCDISSSIGVNMSNIQDAQQILRCAKKLVQRATATDSKNFKVSTNKQAVLQALTVALLPTPTKQSENQISSSISRRALSRLIGLSVGAGHRITSEAGKKRDAIADGNNDRWIMVNDDDKRSKYSEDLLDDFGTWLQNNDKVTYNPCKGETIIKRDQQGKHVRDPVTNELICVSKMIMLCNPRELHNHMIDTFEGARDGDKVLISESKL